jgi:hypothetical protein
MLAFNTLLAAIYVNWRMIVPGMFLGVSTVAVALVDWASALMIVVAGVIFAAVWLWHHLRPATTQGGSQGITLQGAEQTGVAELRLPPCPMLRGFRV